MAKAPTQSTPPRTGQFADLATGGHWIINIASKKDRGEADSIANKLKKLGFPVIVREKRIDGKRWLRIQWQGFASQAEAERADRVLQREAGTSPAWIYEWVR